MSEPKTLPTRYCDTCTHFRYAQDDGPICKKGYNPKFFKPRVMLNDDWGYKRRCEDFEDRRQLKLF